MKSASNASKDFSAKFKKFIWNLGLHAFSLILFFIALGLAFGGFIFYQYVFSAQQGQPSITENILKFDSKTYQNVMDALHAREASNIVVPNNTPVAPVQ